MTFPFPTADDQQNALTERLMRFVVQLQDQITLLKEQAVLQQERITALEAEIIRLKKLNPKPNIKPSTKPSDDSDNDPEGGHSEGQSSEDSTGDDSSPDVEQPKVDKPNEHTRKKRKSPPKPPVDHEVQIAVLPEDLPPGSTRNGHSSYDVQDLEIKTSMTRYWLEQWITPDGKTITARPPESTNGHHFGHQLQCLILHQYFGCGVTQPN